MTATVSLLAPITALSEMIEIKAPHHQPPIFLARPSR